MATFRLGVSSGVPRAIERRGESARTLHALLAECTVPNSEAPFHYLLFAHSTASILRSARGRKCAAGSVRHPDGNTSVRVDFVFRRPIRRATARDRAIINCLSWMPVTLRRGLTAV